MVIPRRVLSRFAFVVQSIGHVGSLGRWGNHTAYFFVLGIRKTVNRFASQVAPLSFSNGLAGVVVRNEYSFYLLNKSL